MLIQVQKTVATDKAKQMKQGTKRRQTDINDYCFRFNQIEHINNHFDSHIEQESSWFFLLAETNCVYASAVETSMYT